MNVTNDNSEQSIGTSLNGCKNPESKGAISLHAKDQAQVEFLCETLANQDSDQFGYYSLAEWVAKILVGMKPPFVYAVCGAWGSGKSSFLGFLAEHLSNKANNPLILYYNAWRATIHSDILASFVAEIKSQVESESWIKNIKLKIDSHELRALTIRILDNAVNVFSDINIATKAFSAVYKGSRKAFKEDFRNIIRAEARIRDSFERLGRLLCDAGVTPIIIIDELDRCTPSSAVRAIEATRMLFGGQDELSYRISRLRGEKQETYISPFRFIISIDVNFICRAFAKTYGISVDEAQLYLDKFIQAKYHFPTKNWKRFIESSVELIEDGLHTGVQHDTECYVNLIGILELDTPRMVNRVVSYMSLWNMRDSAPEENAIAHKIKNILDKNHDQQNELKKFLSIFYFIFGTLVVKYPRYVGPVLRSKILVHWFDLVKPGGSEKNTPEDNEKNCLFEIEKALKKEFSVEGSNEFNNSENQDKTEISIFADIILQVFLFIKNRLEKKREEKQLVAGTQRSFIDNLKKVIEVGFEMRIIDDL